MDAPRTFLFLQGPHGPFFFTLSRALVARGARRLKVGFTGGDQAEWFERSSYRPFRHRPEAWPIWLRRLIRDEGVTDIVLYGDMRPYHRAARAAALAAGITVHCFEEGYLRPFWVTYERDGVNGASRLMDLSMDRIAQAMAGAEAPLREAPAVWGAAWAHVFWSLYHHAPRIADRRYPHFRRHRDAGRWLEMAYYLRRLSVFPRLVSARRALERRVLADARPYHLVLLQLGFDSSLRDHSRYRAVSDFVRDCVDAFEAGAPPDHRLVLKAHPFEDGRENLAALSRRFAEARGLGDRVVFLESGRLAPLLDHARSAVTINSTAAQQALWRGLPVRALGRAIYDKPALVSAQDLTDFFRAPAPPDRAAYALFRAFLLATSQIEGGFYTTPGRRAAAARAAALMWARDDPYDRLLGADAAGGQKNLPERVASM
jgi:capsular polysaccharide export protein